MKNPIQAIIDFNAKAGFITGANNFSNFNDTKESAYLIEEALEPYQVEHLASLFELAKHTAEYTKNPQREVAKAIVANTLPESDFIETVRYVDKYLDAIVFPVGALAKMGLTHQDITHLLNVVTDCIMKKLTVGTDSEGKQLKPVDWVGPEEKIKAYLISKGLY